MQEPKNLNCLLPKTAELLANFIENCSFLEKYVFVGGSALAIHLCHRKSEDLDFFTYEDSFKKKEILEYIKRYKHKEILNQTDEQIDLLINGVKVTFFNAKWEFLQPAKKENFNLASVGSISAMKVSVLFLRAKYRDYYDLYFIAKEKLSLKEIFRSSIGVVDGITFKLFAVALVYIDDIEDDSIDHLEPVEYVTKEKIRDFFEKSLESIS